MQLLHHVIADNATKYPTKSAIVLDGTSHRLLTDRDAMGLPYWH